jgi:myo-inositol-1(or 4)-monophosphatase
MGNLNLQEIHDFMISIAKQAGERIVAAKPTEGAGSKKNCMYLQGVAK